MERNIHTIKLFVLDDRERTDSDIRAPRQINLEFQDGAQWRPLQPTNVAVAPQGHRPHVVEVDGLKTRKLRVELLPDEGSRTGLTEIEVWGDAMLPLPAVPPPAGNLAFNDGKSEFPRAAASHHDRFGGVPKSAIDGITNFLPTPTNRWTSYESKTPTDWLEIDFGKAVEFRRVDLAIYDDRGGVQKPEAYELEIWSDGTWQAIERVKKIPEEPAGSQWNQAIFEPVASNKLRIVFTNAGNARSGVTEVMVWNE